VQERRIRNIMESGRELGIGIRARKMAEGRWVKTIVWGLLVDGLGRAAICLL